MVVDVRMDTTIMVLIIIVELVVIHVVTVLELILDSV
jgi:hypothetical protein